MNRKSGWIAIVPAFLILAAAQVPASPREQLQQYVTQLQANPSDDALRTKIIQIALTLDPKPANPSDLPEEVGAATYAFKSAQSETDMSGAADLFAKALLLAPWRADLYYNEGLSLEKAKRLDEAIKAFRFYLMASPNATDADEVKEKIGALKYQVSQAQGQERAMEQQRRAQEQAAAAAQRLEGRYVCHQTARWQDDDLIFDVKDGQVTYGHVLTADHTGNMPSSWIGEYKKDYTAPLNGTHYDYTDTRIDWPDRSDNDGTISDDGTSITWRMVQHHAYNPEGVFTGTCYRE